MSYVEIYVVNRRGDVIWFDEVHNAGGGALKIWHDLSIENRLHFSLFDETPLPIWMWANEGRLGYYDTLCIWFTYDYRIIALDALPEFIAALEEFYRRHPHPTGDGLIDVLRRTQSLLNISGVAFNHTSVCADVWVPDRDELGEMPDRPFNIYVDNQNHGHVWITRADIELRKAGGF